ncbi:putative bifunctional diguanylate cyclase/phosphodiesterase [Vibrio sp. VB16]|uniref:putative bifunctional diguanylate cyclase/phosphodiesterase n=1 Tax=Vibrio sp. VB16 TaxID=2785746 RepID=UPI001E641395|nr:GGDEF domain-containing phosphodiesterase [Vibrio sp. VB16]UGA57485.1 EAL domain-containing protein [Vibrio sp. VB16]
MQKNTSGYSIFASDPNRNDSFSRVVISCENTLHPADIERVNREIQALFYADKPSEIDFRMYRENGDVIHMKSMVTVIRGNEGQLVRIHGANIDVTEFELSKEKLKLAATVFTHTREGITITDPAGNIMNVNDAFTTTTGYSRQEVLGKNPRMLKSGRHSPAFYAELWETLAKADHWRGEIWNCRKNGEIYPEMLSISAVRDNTNVITHYVALFTDISHIKEEQAKLERIAHYDALTHLPNRILLREYLSAAMQQCQRDKQSLAVVFIDLDEFKAINDKYGHHVGDELLVAVSHRMKGMLRADDTLARIGGDEFVAILTGLECNHSCKSTLSRLLDAISGSVTVGEIELNTSASMGVTFYPQDNSDSDLLVRHADFSMYEAKKAGKNRYHVFDFVHDKVVDARRENIERIRVALNQSEFVLYYQPKVNINKGTVIGAEALIRWQHPERGLLAPAEFLPLVKNHPISIELGEWVITTAFNQITAWQALGYDIPVSVNICASQLQQADFAKRLDVLLSATPQTDPCYLQLEVLETSAIDDLLHVSTIMNDCIKLGVSFALDDFGTGYSSLTYLKHLPINLIKIDQSFIQDMLTNPDDLMIVESVIGLAKSFKREVIAEGVETIAHSVALLKLGCDLVQGYSVAKPMQADCIPKWVDDWPSNSVFYASILANKRLKNGNTSLNITQ